ncbi:hypothetical protein HTG_15775 [Natrinema mahii]|nr:hypothetical protein HTG_15775 [Natrinema mahii]
MADESSGTRDDTDDRTERSVTESDANVGADANRPDSGGGWGVADRSGDSVRDERTDDDDRIPLDLSDSSDAADEDGADAADEYTPESNSTPIEPGDPDVESALFVLLGAISMVLVLVRLVMIPLG